jgi:hypothetical protein
LADGQSVDHVLLARIDPARFHFVVRNASAGDKDLDQWMAQLGAVLIVNGSYFTRYGEPETPLLSDGALLGPKDYDAKAGAYIAASSFTGVRDLAREDWRTARRQCDGLLSASAQVEGEQPQLLAWPSLPDCAIEPGRRTIIQEIQCMRRSFTGSVSFRRGLSRPN